MTSKVDEKDNASLRPPLADALSLVFDSKRRDFVKLIGELLLLRVQQVDDFNVVSGPKPLRLVMVPFGLRQAINWFLSEYHAFVVANSDV